MKICLHLREIHVELEDLNAEAVTLRVPILT